MEDKLNELLVNLKSCRPNVCQFIFFASIYPSNVVALRVSIDEYRQQNPDVKEIDFILNSPGGLADDAYRIIRTLRKNFNIVNIIVPFWAKSAATLLSLGANNIIMDEFGEFGPLDAQLAKPKDDGPQYDRESALNDEHSVSIIESHFKLMFEQMYIRLYEHSKINISKNELSKQLLDNLSKFFIPLLSQIDPYKLGEKKRKLDIGAQYAKRIISQFGSPVNEVQGRLLVDYLIHACPDHGYVIDKDTLDKFVTNVYDSSKFGLEYKNALKVLSTYLMVDDSDDEFIGFIEDESKNSESNTEETNLNGQFTDVGNKFAESVIKQIGSDAGQN